MKISVSNISDYLFCPRNLYLKEYMGLGERLSGNTLKDFILHRVRRELALRQDVVLERASGSKRIRDELESELNNILGDLPALCNGKIDGVDFEGCVSDVRSEISSDLRRISERLLFIVEEGGFSKVVEKFKPWRKEYWVESERLGLVGVIDKVFRSGDNYFVSDIKTVFPGEEVWETDKVSVCAYSMLLEEEIGCRKLGYGFVEYAPVAESRPVLITDVLRKKVLALRDEVVSVLTGDLPDICPHGSGRRCESCSVMEECYGI